MEFSSTSSVNWNPFSFHHLCISVLPSLCSTLITSRKNIQLTVKMKQYNKFIQHFVQSPSYYTLMFVRNKYILSHLINCKSQKWWNMSFYILSFRQSFVIWFSTRSLTYWAPKLLNLKKWGHKCIKNFWNPSEVSH